MQVKLVQLYSGESLHLLPSPKNLHADPDGSSKRETCGISIQEKVFPLSFKYFLLHFSILSWYSFMQWGHFFLELCRIPGI